VTAIEGCLLRERTDQPERAPEHESNASQKARLQRRLVCASCGAVVGYVDAILPAGDTPLIFANPHGRVFELVLLREAQSLLHVGPPTTEHTWFAGYAWQVALCAGCSRHLGWRYLAGEAGRSPPLFFGLLRAELREEDAPEPP
jgi:hypothetical protein